jgi:lipopolysaccharide export system protein LptA
MATPGRLLGIPVAVAMALASPSLLGDTPKPSSGAHLLPGDSIDVQADQLDVDIASGGATLTGNVSLTKGELRVGCPRVELKFDNTPRVTWAKGTGGVVASVHGVHAEAPEAELDLDKQVLDLHGGVRLSRGQGWLQADRALIEIATAKVTLMQVRGSIPVPARPHP